MMEEFGFDAKFVDDVPDCFKCAACKFILRDPVLALQCGHRFCLRCFQKLKDYSVQFNSPLLCTADRKKIDETEVHKDPTFEAIIGNLPVWCTYNGSGCKWSGDLRSLNSHVETCSKNNDDEESPSISDILKDLCKRMDCCEAGIRGKEEEIVQLHKTLHQRNDEIRILKNEKVLILKNEHEKFKNDIKKEMNFLKSQIINEAKKFHQMEEENKVKVQRRNLETNERLKVIEDNTNDIKSEVFKETANLKVQIEELQDQSARYKQEIAALQNKSDNKYTDLEFQVAGIKNVPTGINQDIAQLKDKLSDEIKKADAQVDDVKNMCVKSNEDIDIMKEKLIILTEKNLNSIEEGNATRNLLDKSMNEKNNEINELNAHINRSECILCNVQKISPQETVFKWKMCNYKYYFDIGEQVLSPKFYSQIDGNRCQMKMVWSGDNGEKLGLYIGLCKGRNDGIIKKPFRMKIVMYTFDKNGKKHSFSILPTEVDANRGICFSIHPGQNESSKRRGAEFLIQPDLDNCIINDCITVICTLTPA